MESDRTSPSRSESISDNQTRVRPLQGRTFGPSRRSTKGQWTSEEDEILRDAVQRFKGKNWKKIAQSFKERTDVQCLHRWQKVLNPDLVKGPWSKEEDETIIELVKIHGPKKWSTIAQHLPGRIGKQCRERWHNHLNPNINKEAWTQDEELALIRAHQVYGNKWAELSKFLPGRSDNAIKNHWNSSVKKKLDTYLASGLLSQFQGLPNSIPTIQSVGTSSSKAPHSSEEDSPARDGAEMEEVLQGSQGSAAIGCPQSKSDVGSTSMSTGKEFFEYTLPHEWGTSMAKDWQMNQNNSLDKPSLDLGQDMSGQFLHSLSAPFLHSSNYSGNNGTPSFPLQYSVCLSSSTSMVNVDLATDKSECFFAQEEGGKIICPEASAHCPFSFQNNAMDGSSDSLQYQSLNYQNHVAADGTSTLEVCYPERYGLLGPSSDDGSLLFSDPIGFSDSTIGLEDNGFIHSNEPHGSPSHYRQEDTGMTEQLVQGLDSRVLRVNSFGSKPPENIHYRKEYTGMAEQLDQGLDTSRVIPVNSFGSEPPDNIHCSPALGDVSAVSDEQKDTGALFYEPPRFPSFDIPFFSCDLLQPNSEMQQEYSPLGIRQFMMSSVNCPTPFKLWDSPSRDDSPDAVLKSAAKTFTCTPSILKKRHRDMSSPLSERRMEKKLESTSSVGSFSSLARGFSRLEVMFSETENENPSVPSQLPNHDTDHEDENKENKDPGSLKEQKEGKGGFLISETGRLGKHTDGSVPHDNIKQLGGVKMLCTVTTRGVALSETPLSVVCSPRSLGRKDGSDLATVTSMNLPTSSISLEKVDHPGSSSSGVENNSIFGGSPFNRSMESPSAWKSPWFINSFVPGPRVDTDITVEDMELYMSPAERSYDALGLMKQLSEQTASAFATAQEVLGNETQKTSKNNNNQEQKDEMEGTGDNKHQSGHNSPAGSTIMAPECRTLDFSECGTPGKVTENGMSSNGIIFSTSSSYLLKGCR